jgi:hypothetical protein
MGSNRGARLLLAVGFVAAFIGYDAWIVSHAILDPGTTKSAAHALIESSAVRNRLADDLTKELEQQLPTATADPHVRAAAAAAVRDPRVADAFAETVVRIREAILSDGSGKQTFTVDGRALTAALHDALLPVDPQLAAQVARSRPLEVKLESDNLSHVNDPRSGVNVIAWLGIVAALLFVTAALLLDPERRTIARAGRRTAYLAVTPLLVFALLPHVLSLSSSDAPQIASALLRVVGDRVLPSAIALVLVGLAIVAGTIVWPRDLMTPRARKRPALPAEPADWRRTRVAPEPTTISEKTYL